jgi:hypothetical protein
VTLIAETLKVSCGAVVQGLTPAVIAADAGLVLLASAIPLGGTTK